MNTFKAPLKPKRTDFSFKSGVFDYPAIRKSAATNPFGIEPDPPMKPPIPCSNADCDAVYYPDEQQWRGQCKGYCA